ncbi:MAG: ArsR/SmtB family transcription factor [Hyphomonadaceae bacterium]
MRSAHPLVARLPVYTVWMSKLEDRIPAASPPFWAFMRALAHRHRLRLLEALATAPQSLTELSARLGVAHATLTAHLLALQRVGLVVKRRHGGLIIYELSHADVWPLIAMFLTDLSALHTATANRWRKRRAPLRK